MKQSEMRGSLKATVFKIKGNRIVKALAKMTKKKKEKERKLVKIKRQPDLKNEAQDKGRGRGFHLGASKGASEAGAGGAVPGLSSSVLPTEGTFHAAPHRGCEADHRAKTPDTHQVFQLETHYFPFKQETRSPFKTENGGNRCGPTSQLLTPAPDGGGRKLTLPQVTKGWPGGTPAARVTLL